MKKTLIYLLLAPFFIINSTAQFTQLPNEIRGLRSGSLTCSDFDSDGDIDILNFGNDIDAKAHSSLYINDNLTFTENKIEVFPVLFEGTINWADFNNNGKMDLAIIGWSDDDATVISRILEHDSEFINCNIDLPGISRGAIKWGDFNNDNQIDLLIAGQDENSNSITKLFENRESEFIDINIENVKGVSFGDVALADYNSDGLLDFIITGVTGTVPNTGDPITELYRNTGDGFELDDSNDFIGLYHSSVEWGDADNDGDLDLLATGMTKENSSFTGLYINNESSFTLAEVSLPNVIEGFAKWGDFDNDNDLDIMIAGDQIGVDARILKVFRNDNLVFEEVFNADGISQCSGAWADINNDGYLDFMISGQKNNLDLATFIYINEFSKKEESSETTTQLKRMSNSSNDTPSIPLNLNTTILDSKATLSWDKSIDDNTSSESLSYNISLHKDNKIIIPSLSNHVGLRSVVRQGNANLSTSYTTAILEPGNYSWRVQSLDNSYQASAFSEVSSFSIEPTIVSIDKNPNPEDQIKIFPNPFSDKIQIKNINQQYQYQLLDLHGKVILKGSSTKESITFSNVDQGTYILTIKFDKQLVRKKVIKL